MTDDVELIPTARKRKPNKKMKSVGSEVLRFNLHQLLDKGIANETADKIDLAVGEEKKRSAKNDTDVVKTNYEFTEPKKTANTPIAAQVIQLGRTHYDRVEKPIPLPKRPQIPVYTSSMPAKELILKLQKKVENEKKRSAGSLLGSIEENQPKRQKPPTFASFASVKSFDDIFGNNMGHFNNPPKRSNKIPLTRIPTLTVNQLEHNMWIPWHEELRSCCCEKTKTCKSLTEERIRHPLKPDLACMAQMSVAQYEAFQMDIAISPLASHGDQFFKNYICIFCYRYQLTQIICDDSTMAGSSITYEIPDYYHIVDIKGEYKSSVCFQNQGGNLRGVNGNVVLYDPNTFIPVVGLVSQTNPREIERVLDMETYMSEKDQLTSRKLAYGWRERGVFFDNNAVPECAEINPYSYSYTRIKGGSLSPRLILKGYFAKLLNTSKYNIFEEFGTLVKKFHKLWTTPHPMTEPRRIEFYEFNNFTLDVEAMGPWERYHTWQHVCLHQLEKPPRHSECKIYYTFLYVVNGLFELSKSGQYPVDIMKKLKRYTNAFAKFQDYYKECLGDFSDLRIKTYRTKDFTLGYDCNFYLSCYPRTSKIGFTVHEYEYLEFETITLKTLSPERELSELYREITPVHGKSVLEKENQIEGILTSILKIHSGPYHNATVFYNHCLTLLREPHRFFDWALERDIEWPRNQLIQFNKSRDKEREIDVDYRKELETVTDNMTSLMRRILRKIFRLIRAENSSYLKFSGLLDYALMPYLECREKVQKMIVKGPRLLFQKLDNPDFSYLLPEGYIADVSGINFVDWQNNTALLTALVRVHILDRMIALENVHSNRKRHLLSILRNSHIPLVSVICELPANVPFKRNDMWLRFRPIMEPGNFISPDPSLYKPTIDVMAANIPYSTLTFHEGRLPNISSVLLHTNYFSDDADKYSNLVFKHKTTMTPIVGKILKAIFSNDPVRHCNKTTIAKLSKKKNIADIVKGIDFGQIIPKRLLILQLLKCSLLGMYEHATVKPSFRISCQLTNVLENADSQDVRELLDHLLNHTVVGEKRKKLRFDKILSDCYLEYLHRLHSDTPIQQTLFRIYGIDPVRKSLISMDFVRLGVSQNSLSLHLLFDMRQRNPIKLSSKVVNDQCMSSIDKICQVILKSDEPRYASHFKKKAHIPSVYQIKPDEMVIVDRFVKKLSPTGTLYAEELRYIGLTEATLKLLADIHTIVSRPKYNIHEAIDVFQNMEIRQSSIVSYFFNELQQFLTYGLVNMRNLEFVEKQEKVMKKVAGIPQSSTDYTLPEGIYTTVISPCCNTWNGVSTNSQYYKKEFTGEDCTHYLMPHGNQSIVVDWISDDLYCKATKKPAKKKKGNARAAPSPLPTDESEFFTVTSTYIEKELKRGTEPKRLKKIRIVENRVAGCGTIPSIKVDLRDGRVLTVNKKVRHPFLKRKTTQFQKRKSRGSKDPSSLYPSFKSMPLMMANPPYVLSPCCGSIRGTGPQCWGVNGYYCGACLPRSNIENSILYEILCFACRKVVANTGSTKCPISSCPSNQHLEPFALVLKQDLLCKHGASPVYVVDDAIGKPTFAYFCDSCYKNFESCEPGVVAVSAVVSGDYSLPVSIIEGKELNQETKRKSMYD